MNRKIGATRLLHAAVCFGLLCLAGCATEREFEAKGQICQDKVDKARAMEIAEDVLGSMHFKIEKADPDGNYIRTRPLSGGQFFEIWRQDNRDSYSTAESSLHTIQRIVELDFSRKAGQLCIDCRAKVRRLSLPERQVDSTAKAYTMFSASSPSLQRLELRKEQKKDMAWLDLGPDPKLETEILNRIEKQIIQLQQKVD